MLKVFCIGLISMLLVGCRDYRTAFYEISENHRKAGYDHLAYFTPKSEFNRLPSCSQLLSSEKRNTLYYGLSDNYTSAQKYGKDACVSKSGEDCAIIYQEKRYMGGIWNKVVEGTCFVDRQRNVILAETQQNAARIAEATENAQSTMFESQCLRMGFKPETTDIAYCKLSLKQAQDQAEHYNRQQLNYSAELARIRRQQDDDRNLALMQLGLGMASGSQNSSFTRTRNTPLLPIPPAPVSIISPSGNRYNCSYSGAAVMCR